MATRVIVIKKGDPKTGSLTLSDRGHTAACAGDSILWQVHPTSGVYEVTSIDEKTGADDIWASPPRPQGNNWRGTTKSTAQPLDRYPYSIHWKASEAGRVLEHDPVISIRPQPIGPVHKLLVYAVFAVLTLLGVKFFAKKFKQGNVGHLKRRDKSY